MSLVLNGGVSGSAETQAAYVDAKIITTLPFSVSAWVKTSATAGSGTSRCIAQLCQASAAVNQNAFLIQARRSTSPALTMQTASNPDVTYTTSASATTTVAVNTMASGTTTTVDAPAHGVIAGRWVRVTGTTGFSPDLGGKDYEVLSVTTDTLTLNVSTTGTYTGTCTIAQSQIQPSAWTLVVSSFASAGTIRKWIWTGIEGSSIHAYNDSSLPSAGSVLDTVFGLVDRWCIGAQQQATNDNWLNGEIAHVAAWNNKQLSDAEAAALLTTTPDNASWGAPAVYWPLIADENDAIGSNHLTLVGSPSITSAGPSIVSGTVVAGFSPAFSPGRGLVFGG